MSTKLQCPDSYVAAKSTSKLIWCLAWKTGGKTAKGLMDCNDRTKFIQTSKVDCG